MFDRTGQKVLILLTTMLAILSAAMLAWQDRAWGLPASSGSEAKSAAEELVITPFLVSPGHDGIAVLDRGNRTICLYQFQPNRPAHERFVLLAARQIGYDLQLTDYNTAEPRPQQVKALLEQSGGSMEKPEAANDLEPAPPVGKNER